MKGEHLFYNQVLLNSTDLQSAVRLYLNTTVTTAERKSCAVCAVSEVHWNWTEKTLVCYKCSTYIKANTELVSFQ